ncbi:MAG: hypothetical protein ABFS08_12695 [Pseudomonadota bacterium]
MLTIKKLIAPLAALVGLTAVAFEAQATPAFARQMEMNCFGCHNQSVPMLNSFGRQFKLSGYTMTSGNKSMITGGDLGLSVPLAINAGVGVKSTVIDNDAPNKRAEIAIPAGSALMVGGKLSENMGANILIGNDGMGHLQVAYSAPVAAGNAGLSYYGTMGHGPFIAVESHNTGLHKELGLFDSSKRTNAAQFMGMGLGSGPATGMTAFYGGHGLKAAFGMWSLGFNSTNWNGGVDTAGSMGSLYRLTYDTPQFAGWGISIGAFGVSGTHEGSTDLLFENTKLATSGWVVPGDVNDHEVTASGFDIQAQGQIVGIDTQIVVSNVSNYEFTLREQDGTLTPMPNPQTVAANMMDRDLAATSIQIQIMPTSAWGVRVGYMTVDDARATTTVGPNTYVEQSGVTTSYGVNYNYADNVRFSLESSTKDPDTGTSDTQIQLTTIVAF